MAGGLRLAWRGDLVMVINLGNDVAGLFADEGRHNGDAQSRCAVGEGRLLGPFFSRWTRVGQLYHYQPYILNTISPFRPEPFHVRKFLGCMISTLGFGSVGESLLDSSGENTGMEKFFRDYILVIAWARV